MGLMGCSSLFTVRWPPLLWGGSLCCLNITPALPQKGWTSPPSPSPPKHGAHVSLLHPALVIPTFAGMKSVLGHSVTVSPTLT